MILFRLPSNFFDSGMKPAVAYSDSESDNEEIGNEDAKNGNVSTSNLPPDSTTQNTDLKNEVERYILYMPYMLYTV